MKSLIIRFATVLFTLGLWGHVIVQIATSLVYPSIV
jgi:hypothetical protein